MTQIAESTRDKPDSLRRTCRRRWTRSLGGLRVLGILLISQMTGCGAESPLATPNVLLVSIDTLRADRLGVYGHAPARTPQMDALAARGVRFEVAISPAPITLPSHSSLLTALDPPFHGVRDNGIYRLDKSHRTLAECFRDAGYRTGAFVGAYVLDASFGLDQGFDLYDDSMGSRSSSTIGYAERRAGAVVDSALDWLGSLDGERPFFAWLHFYDPHADYQPPAGFLAAFSRNRYDGEVAYVDFQLGRLLGDLEARGWLDHTVVAVTSDHGESFYEHGEQTHTHFIYDATQRVPMILAGPGLEAGRVVPEQVALVDLPPTLLALSGLPRLSEVQGKSLLPLLRGAPGHLEEAYLETTATLAFGWAPLVGLRAGRDKYIRAPHPELYDLAEDPGELRNLSAERPERVAELEARLTTLLSQAPFFGGGPAMDSAGVESTDAESRERLEALGYVVGPTRVRSDPLAATGADPKDAIEEADRFNLATSYLKIGSLAEALDAATALARESPKAELYLALEAMIRLRAGDPDGAVEVARRSVGINPYGANGWILVAEAEAARGNREAAHAALSEGRRYLPGRNEFLEAEITLFLDTGKLEDARNRLDALPVRSRRQARFKLLDGRVLELGGDSEGARHIYNGVLEETLDHGGALLRLALLSLREGSTEEGSALLERIPQRKAQGFRTDLEIATAYVAGGAPARGAEHLAAYLERTRETGFALEAYASLLLAAGKEDEAEAAFRRALKVDPGAVRSANNLASLLARRKRSLDEALHWAGVAQQAAPSALTTDTLAEVHLAREEPEEALRVLEALDESPPAILEGHLRYLQAQALDALGRGDEARRLFEEALAAPATKPAGDPPAWIAETRARLARP